MAQLSGELENSGTLGKYRGLIVSLGVLVLLVVALLLLNLFFSQTLEKSGQTTAAAGRQAALVQQVSKDLFIINSQYQRVLPYEDETKALKDNMDIFSNTLNAFSEGGVIVSFDEASSQPTQTQIDKLDTPAAIEVVDKAKQIWSKYSSTISPLFEDRQHAQSELSAALDVAEENNQELTVLMDSLSNEIQSESESNLKYLRYFQIAGIALTALMFAWTVLVTLRNLRKNDEELDLARQETTGILNTVKEGLFLLDNDLMIGSQHSNEALEIFEVDEIQGRKFAEFLGDVLDSSDPGTMEDFVKLLFDEHVIEDLISSLNPLDRVQTSFDQEDGTSVTKYLNFDFFRVIHRGEIEQVLVSVRDITARVLLEQELESTKEQGEQQVEMLVSFLQADPTMLKSFLLDSRESLSDINAILKDPLASKKDLKNKLDKMFIAVHRMKGEASSMSFDAFAEKATNIKGIDFLPLTIELDKLISYVDALNELSARLTSGSAVGGEISLGETTILAASPSKEAMQSQWNHLTSLVETVAKDSKKEVEFVSSGLAESNLSEGQKKLVNDVSIQLIRNSIVHGIELPKNRLKNNKPSVGRVDLRLAQLSDGRVELVVRDDGNGLDVESIKSA